LTITGLSQSNFATLLTSACQNVNLKRLTLGFGPNYHHDPTAYIATVLTSQVRHLCIVSSTLDHHTSLLGYIVTHCHACSLASLELAGSDSQALDLCEENEEDFWLNLLQTVLLTPDIVALRLNNLNLPTDSEESLYNAIHWIQKPFVYCSGSAPTKVPALLNQSLLVFDPGLDLPPEVTGPIRDLIHGNRARFAFPDRFFKSAASSFGDQVINGVINAGEMGEEIAKHLIPEEGTRQDELTLALLNTTSYRAAVTSRSEEFRNELFKLIDTHQTGAIHTLRQMMLEAHVGLIEEHLEQVWQRARERGVDLPDLPVQWLPPDRE